MSIPNWRDEMEQFQFGLGRSLRDFRSAHDILMFGTDSHAVGVLLNNVVEPLEAVGLQFTMRETNVLTTQARPSCIRRMDCAHGEWKSTSCSFLISVGILNDMIFDQEFRFANQLGLTQLMVCSHHFVVITLVLSVFNTSHKFVQKHARVNVRGGRNHNIISKPGSKRVGPPSPKSSPSLPTCDATCP